MRDMLTATIAELAAEYMLHPDIRDVYVEGHRDATFYAWFLNEVLPDVEVEVITIDRVDVPDALLATHGFRNKGNKEKVVCLAVELGSRVTRSQKHLTMIADSSFDFLFNDFRTCGLLLYTDCSDLITYTFGSRTVSKLLSVTFSGCAVTASAIRKAIVGPLVDLLVVRATNMKLKWGMKWVRLKPSCKKLPSGVVGLNVQHFVDRYLKQNGKYKDKEAFWRTFKRLKQHVTGPRWRFIRGHDYVELLSHCLRPNVHPSVRCQARPKDLEGALMTCLELNWLKKQPLFSKLALRLA